MWGLLSRNTHFANVFRVVALTYAILLINEIGANSIVAGPSGDVPHSIQKRDIYVTFQERAQTICIGLCMYHDKRPFVRCERRCRIGEADMRNRNSRRTYGRK
ncbi:hypothetical protein LSAT2_021816 [Lamellibrachia satsuma]|nr:hypothetical protein LSAT2_021816 [Lamellibrachia satsuma]